MAGESWQQTKVDEMIRRGVLALNDGYRVRNVELGPVGIPFVRGGDIGDGGINTAVEDHIRPEFPYRVQSKLTRPFDVAFITKGTVGRVGMVRPGQPQSVFAPQVCYWRSLDPDQLEPRFLFYLLTSAEFQANLDAVKTHGSMAADYVSMTDQRDFRLTFPPIREQKAIAAVLGALDEKIELNRRMNATLEAMARALFQSWFVDFDPVRAIPAAVVLLLQPVSVLVIELEFAGIAVTFFFFVAVVLIEFFLVIPAAAAAFLLIAVGVLVEFAPVAGAAVSTAVVEFGAGLRRGAGFDVNARRFWVALAESAG